MAKRAQILPVRTLPCPTGLMLSPILPRARIYGRILRGSGVPFRKPSARVPWAMGEEKAPAQAKTIFASHTTRDMLCPGSGAIVE